MAGGATGAAAEKRSNFEFDAPQWEDFTLPQYAQQRALLEAAVYPQATQAQDGWTVTQLMIPHEGGNHGDCTEAADDEGWFQRLHAEHEPTSPCSPAGPLISPSPAVSRAAVATASPAARSGSRGCPASAGKAKGKESLSVGRTSSSVGSSSRAAGGHREYSSPRPALRGRPMRVPRPEGAVAGAAAAASAEDNHRGSGQAGSIMASGAEGSRGSFLSILGADGASSDMKSPLGGRGRGVNSNPVGRMRALVDSSSPLGGSPMHTRDSLIMDMLSPGSPMLGSPLARTMSRNARQSGGAKLPRTSASIEESLLAGSENGHEEQDDSHGVDYGHAHAHAHDLPALVQTSELPPTNWSSSIPATPPILTASLLRLLDQVDKADEGEARQGTKVSEQFLPARADEGDEQRNKRSHSPVSAIRGGIGSRAMRVPAVNNNPPPVHLHAQIRASPLQLPIIKRVKVDGRFCPAPPPGRTGSRSASPPGAAAATTTVPATKKEKPVKLDDLRRLLAEHNQKLRPHPHNNITRRR